MKYLSVDIETTGLDPDQDDIIEFGAVIDDLNHPKPVETLPQFHCYVLPSHIHEKYKDYHIDAQDRHRRYHGQPYALSMHSNIFRRIAKKEAGFVYCEARELLGNFYRWAQSYGMGEKTVFAGKNFASFDLQFLKKLPNNYFLEGMSYRTFDPAPLYFRVGEDIMPPSTKTCLERAGLKSDVPHTSIEDALNVIRLIRHGLLLKEPAVFTEHEDVKPIYANTPARKRGCSVVVEVVNGKLTPVAVK